MKKLITQIALTVVLMCSMTAHATAYDESNWFITVDVEQVRTKVLPMLPASKENYSFAQALPQAVQNITMYGHSKTEDDLSVAVTGQFAGFSFNDYLLEQLIRVDEESAISLFATVPYNGRSIEQYQFKEKHGAVSFYTAKVNDSLVVLSLQEAEVKNWIDQKYNSQELQNNGLVSLLVNVESAMASVGADLDRHNAPFKSAMFNKILQFSASVYETGDRLNVEAALSTADQATASQLEQVINGLIAMNALSNLDESKPVLAALMAELVLSIHDHELLLTTSLPYALLPTIDID